MNTRAEPEVVEVVIFEDSAIKSTPSVIQAVGFPDLTVSDEPRFRWHKSWNALGSTRREILNEGYKAIGSPEEFARALEWCLTNESPAVCFVDMDLGANTVVSKSHVEMVAKRDNDIVLKGADKWMPGIVHRCNRDSESIYRELPQGVLLILAIAANRGSRTQVVYASSQVDLPREFEGLVNERLRYPIVISGSLTNPTAANSATVVSRLRMGIGAFIAAKQRLSVVDDVFWPRDNVAWFKGNDAKSMPHNHEQIVPEQRTMLLSYLTKILGDAELAEIWATKKSCYETLKSFLGHFSLIQGTKETPHTFHLGTLLFPLAHAVGGRDWAGGVWDEPLGLFGEISLKTRARAVEFVEYSYCLFQAMGIQEGATNGEKNSVEVTSHKDKLGYHLHIDFGFVCHLPTKQGRYALLEKIQFSGDGADGQVSNNLYKLWRLTFTGGQGERACHVSVYPVREDQSWTRLHFWVP